MIMVNPVVSSCGARGCIDVYDPVRVKRLKEWAESDAKFLRRLSIKKHEKDDHHQMTMILNKKKKSHEDDQEEEEEEGFSRLVTSERSESLDWFTIRQRYLRSYTFYNPNKEENSKDAIKKIFIKKLLPKKKKSQKEPFNSSSRLRHCFNFLLSCVAQVHVHAH